MRDSSALSPDPTLSRWMMGRLASLQAERASATEALRGVQSGLAGNTGGTGGRQDRIESLMRTIARLDHAIAQWDTTTAHVR
ncbi:MAG: hypothetical protein ABI906_09285 [Pseudomonadota bacterium]